MNLWQVLGLRTIVYCHSTMQTEHINSFSSAISQPGRRGGWRSPAWGQPRGGEQDQADQRRQRVRGGQAHPAGLSRGADQTENFTGQSFVRLVPGGGRHDHHQLRLAPRGLPAGLQTEGEPSQHFVIWGPVILLISLDTTATPVLALHHSDYITYYTFTISPFNDILENTEKRKLSNVDTYYLWANHLC